MQSNQSNTLSQFPITGDGSVHTSSSNSNAALSSYDSQQKLVAFSDMYPSSGANSVQLQTTLHIHQPAPRRALSSLVQPTFPDQTVQRTEGPSGERSIQPDRQSSPLGTFVSSLSANVPSDVCTAPIRSLFTSAASGSARISQFQSEDVPKQDPLSFLNTLVQPLVQCGDRSFGPASCHSVRSGLPKATMASTSSCSDSGDQRADQSFNPPFHLAPAAQPNVHRYIHIGQA
jgi:hypothetical protein